MPLGLGASLADGNRERTVQGGWVGAWRYDARYPYPVPTGPERVARMRTTPPHPNPPDRSLIATNYPLALTTTTPNPPPPLLRWGHAPGRPYIFTIYRDRPEQHSHSYEQHHGHKWREEHRAEHSPHKGKKHHTGTHGK